MQSDVRTKKTKPDPQGWPCVLSCTVIVDYEPEFANSIPLRSRVLWGCSTRNIAKYRKANNGNFLGLSIFRQKIADRTSPTISKIAEGRGYLDKSTTIDIAKVATMKIAI